MNMFRTQLLKCALLAAALPLATGSSFAQDEEAPPPPPSLAELASEADLVALVQVKDTDYEYAREFPTGGTAFLAPLINYKLARPAEDMVEVYDEGLHEFECYFDNPTVYEEGTRHLLFVRDNPEVEGQYLRLSRGCALDVLVTKENRYALRYPLSGIVVSDDVSQLAAPMDFQDSNAVFADEDITVAERNDLLERGLLMELEDGRFRYTHGVALSDIRKLLGEDNITLDRALRRGVNVED